MTAGKIRFATWAAAFVVLATGWPGCSCGSDSASPEIPASPAAATAPGPLALEAHAVPDIAPPIAEEDLIGTAWQAGDLRLAFEPNGVLQVRDDGPDAAERAPGSWKLTGAQLTIRLDDFEYVFEAQGPTIRYGGKPLQRFLP